jgi:hypothetical protein
MRGIHAFHPDAVVLDFRLMTYRWGNSLLRVFADITQFKDGGAGPGEPNFPVVVVTSARCQSAFLTLVTPIGASAVPWHFDDIDAAIEYAVEKSKEWLDL